MCSIDYISWSLCDLFYFTILWYFYLLYFSCLFFFFFLFIFFFFFFFFFQAEDGIRDRDVTGVQTLCSSDLTRCRGHRRQRVCDGLDLLNRLSDNPGRLPDHSGRLPWRRLRDKAQFHWLRPRVLHLPRRRYRRSWASDRGRYRRQRLCDGPDLLQRFPDDPRGLPVHPQPPRRQQRLRDEAQSFGLRPRLLHLPWGR